MSIGEDTRAPADYVKAIFFNYQVHSCSFVCLITLKLS